MAYGTVVVLRTVTSPLKPLPQSLVTDNATDEDGVAAREGVGAAMTAGVARVTAGAAGGTGAAAGVGAGSLLAIVMTPVRSAMVARFGDERLIEKVSFGS